MLVGLYSLADLTLDCKVEGLDFRKEAVLTRLVLPGYAVCPSPGPAYSFLTT